MFTVYPLAFRVDYSRLSEVAVSSGILVLVQLGSFLEIVGYSVRLLVAFFFGLWS